MVEQSVPSPEQAAKNMKNLQAAILKLKPSPGASILQAWVQDGVFEEKLKAALANGGKLTVSEDELDVASAIPESVTRRGVLKKALPLAIMVSGIAGSQVGQLVANHQNNPLGFNPSKEEKVFNEARDRYLAIKGNPTEAQLEEVKIALEAWRQTKIAYEQTGVEALVNICNGVGIGSIVAGLLAEPALDAADILNKSRYDFSAGRDYRNPDIAAESLQVLLDDLLKQKHPELFAQMQTAREGNVAER